MIRPYMYRNSSLPVLPLFLFDLFDKSFDALTFIKNGTAPGGLRGGKAHTFGEGGRPDERNGFVSGEFAPHGVTELNTACKKDYEAVVSWFRELIIAHHN